MGPCFGAIGRGFFASFGHRQLVVQLVVVWQADVEEPLVDVALDVLELAVPQAALDVEVGPALVFPFYVGTHSIVQPTRASISSLMLVRQLKNLRFEMSRYWWDVLHQILDRAEGLAHDLVTIPFNCGSFAVTDVRHAEFELGYHRVHLSGRALAQQHLAQKLDPAETDRHAGQAGVELHRRRYDVGAALRLGA